MNWWTDEQQTNDRETRRVLWVAGWQSLTLTGRQVNRQRRSETNWPTYAGKIQTGRERHVVKYKERLLEAEGWPGMHKKKVMERTVEKNVRCSSGLGRRSGEDEWTLSLSLSRHYPQARRLSVSNLRLLWGHKKMSEALMYLVLNFTVHVVT